jgi:hypothetical protein
LHPDVLGTGGVAANNRAEARARDPISVDPVPLIGFIRAAPERAPVAELVDAPDSKSRLSTLRRLAREQKKAFDFRQLSEYGKARGWGC